MDAKDFERTLNEVYKPEPDEGALRQAQVRLTQTLANEKASAILYTRFEHPLIAIICLAIRNNKLIAIDFGISADAFVARIEKQFGVAPYWAIDELIQIENQVRAYLNGERQTFDIPVDISQLTDFQRQVLFATRQVPRGQIATYMDIARKIGNPKAVRAVGQALGRNPIPIVIPCHRVIASNGSLGGYSGGGGLETKAKLLQLEGAQLI